MCHLFLFFYKGLKEYFLLLLIWVFGPVYAHLDKSLDLKFLLSGHLLDN